MQKTDRSRTFDGPRKPRAKKHFGTQNAAGRGTGAPTERERPGRGETSSEYERDRRGASAAGRGRVTAGEKHRGSARRTGPTSYENAPSYTGERGQHHRQAAPRPEREDRRPGDGWERGQRGGERERGSQPRGYQSRDGRPGGRDGGYRPRSDDGYRGGAERRERRGDGGYRGEGDGGYRGYRGAEQPRRSRDDRGASGRPERDETRTRQADRRAGGADGYRERPDRRDAAPRWQREQEPRQARGGYRSERDRDDSRGRDRADEGYRARRNWGDSPRDGAGRRDAGRGSAPRGGYHSDRADRRQDEQRPAFVPAEDVKREKLTAVVEDASIAELGFGDLGLDPRIVEKLRAQGITAPFPIQAATIPDAVAGRNVLGRARTGSGKTVAYAAPILTRLLSLEPSRTVGRDARALILAPTRELALQIDKVVQPLARTVGLFTIAVFGGVPPHKQATGLKRGVDVIIATPGRLEDLAERGLIDLSAIRIMVIDEADHMCELGFIEPVERILGAVHAGGQKMLYSATLDEDVASLVTRFLPDAVVHEAETAEESSGTIDHQVLLIDNRDKAGIVSELVEHNGGRTVVFTRTRAYAEMLSEQLNDEGIGAAALHGDLKQAQRTRNLSRLTSGRVDVLVATDVAARGIHVDDVTLVIQADAPDDYKTYLHRSGRTGRAGADGVVVTLIPRGRRRRMNDLLERAEVTAPMREARPGDPLLASLV